MNICANRWKEKLDLDVHEWRVCSYLGYSCQNNLKWERLHVYLPRVVDIQKPIWILIHCISQSHRTAIAILFPKMTFPAQLAVIEEMRLEINELRPNIKIWLLILLIVLQTVWMSGTKQNIKILICEQSLNLCFNHGSHKMWPILWLIIHVLTRSHFYKASSKQ